MLEGMAKRDALFDQVCVEMGVRDGKKDRKRKSTKTSVTDFSGLQASEWWLIQHDDEP